MTMQANGSNDFHFLGNITYTSTPSNKDVEKKANAEKAMRDAVKIYFPALINALGGLEAVYAFPEIHRDNMLGYDHVDYISRKELRARVMRGISITYRPFIAMHLVCYKDGEYIGEKVARIYQKYADNKHEWLVKGIGGPIGDMLTYGDFPNHVNNSFILNRIRDLMNGLWISIYPRDWRKLASLTKTCQEIAAVPYATGVCLKRT